MFIESACKCNIYKVVKIDTKSLLYKAPLTEIYTIVVSPVKVLVNRDTYELLYLSRLSLK